MASPSRLRQLLPLQLINLRPLNRRLKTKPAWEGKYALSFEF
jgi:hypothetical protein